MCTWAGYIGNKKAAPILLEMGEKIEGVWSGFYSGAVTLDEEEFHYEKVVGNLECLKSQRDIAAFPGNIGLFHSRTNSKGTSKWAQPFVLPENTVAVVAQGSYGIFSGHSTRLEVANMILEHDRTFSSASKPCGHYPRLKNNMEVHSTEIVGQAVAIHYEACGDRMEAIRITMTKIPDEAVYVFIFRDDPQNIYVGNVNQRVVVGRDESGAYLASSTLAFPKSVNWIMEIPGNTIAKVSASDILLSTLCLKPKFQVVQPFPAKMEEEFIKYVQKNPGCFLAQIIDSALAPLFKGECLERRAVAGYQIMERLLDSGIITMKTKTISGANDKVAAVRTYFYPEK